MVVFLQVHLQAIAVSQQDVKLCFAVRESRQVRCLGYEHESSGVFIVIHSNSNYIYILNYVYFAFYF